MREVSTGSWDGSLEDRFSRSQPVPGEPVVRDALLSADWTGCLSGQTGNNCTGGSAEIGFSAPEVRARCESADWGGHEDWRAPSLDELATLMGPDANAAFRTVLPYIPEPIIYLVTGHYGDGAATSRSIQVSGPTVALTARNANAVVCIRDGLADTRVEECVTTTVGVYSEPVTSISSTGQEWTACVLGRSGRFCELLSDTLPASTLPENGEMRCDELEYGGHEDWRLPSHSELRGLVDMSSAQPTPLDNRAFGMTTTLSTLLSTSVVDVDELESWGMGVPNFTAVRAGFNARAICVRNAD